MTSYRSRIVDHGEADPATILENPLNWRGHPATQRAALEAVLDEVGWVQDVVINRTTGRLVDGHLRVQVARERGESMVPVVYVELSEEEERLILASLDPLAAMADTNKEQLAALMASIDGSGERTAALLEAIGKQAGVVYSRVGQTDPEATPEVPDGAVYVERGFVYALGGHRLMCGDATSAEDVVILLGGEKPALMVTDPPYGVDYDPEWRAEAGVNKNRAKMGEVANDDRADWTEAWKLSPADVAYVWHGGLHAGTVQASLEAAGYETRTQIVWAKDRFALSRGHYHWQHEPCWYAVRKGEAGRWNGDRSQSTLWSIPARDDSGHGHPTQKPVECMERPLRNHEGDVYEPFCGSGTTLIAAERAGRRAYAMEIEPKYVQIALLRWEAYTGREAERMA